jgi:hypothetical protein
MEISKESTLRRVRPGSAHESAGLEIDTREMQQALVDQLLREEKVSAHLGHVRWGAERRMWL